MILVLDIDFGSAGFNWYDLFFIASAASVTANAFVIKTAQDRLSADSDVIGYYNNFVVLVLFTLSSLIAGDFEALGAVELEVWHVFAFLGGGLAQTLIYVFYYRNLKSTPCGSSNFICSLCRCSRASRESSSLTRSSGG